MAQVNIAFPGTHSTATNAIKVEPLIWFDATYIHTKSGTLKAAAVVINLLGFILASIPHCNSCVSVTFFNIVAMFGFWISLILLSLYMFHVVEKAPTVPWLLMEFVFSAVWSVLYFLVALIILTRGGIYAAAGFFGFAATVIYAADAFFSYQSYQAGEVAQSERTQPVQNA